MLFKYHSGGSKLIKKVIMRKMKIGDKEKENGHSPCRLHK